MSAQEDMPAISDVAAQASIEHLNYRMDRVDRMIADFIGYFLVFLFLGMAMGLKRPDEVYP